MREKRLKKRRLRFVGPEITPIDADEHTVGGRLDPDSDLSEIAKSHHRPAINLLDPIVLPTSQNPRITDSVEAKHPVTNSVEGVPDGDRARAVIVEHIEHRSDFGR
jgi:hypothetical protein